MHPAILFPAAWIAWLVSWGIAARWSSPAVARPAAGPVLRYRVCITLGAALICTAVLPALRVGPSWRLGPGALAACLALTVAGFLFAWWARWTLGTLWSASVTRKAGHRVVDRGPFALVRHPIYTGLLLAGVASAAAGGTTPALAGVALFALGFRDKARLEERFLSETLGAEYDAYRSRVPMLVPFTPPG